MRWIWIGLFAVSLLLLLAVLWRSRYSRRWLYGAALNIATAGIVLYLINFIGLPTNIYIPVNLTTLAVVSLLGLPGLLLLVCLKLVIL
jgi:inhibitor of the pro-sigma K processing machinery